MKKRLLVSRYGLRVRHTIKRNFYSLIIVFTLVILSSHFYFMYHGIEVMAETKRMTMEMKKMNTEFMHLENAVFHIDDEVDIVAYIVTENSDPVTVSLNNKKN